MAGEAKRKRRHAAILAAGRQCIYCANPADTVEHMPPISLFWRRDRPKGLEFPCCEACNQATKHSDLVAALLSRLYPNAPSSIEQGEVSRLLRAVTNNVPGLLQEMEIGRGGQKLAATRYGIDISKGGGFIRLDGPIAQRHMTIFAAKLGFALFHECHGEPVPISGAVFPIFYSNIQAITGEMPAQLMDILPDQPMTLRAGRKHVGDQFDYVWRTAPDEGITVLFSTFRQSFAAGAIVYHDRATFEPDEIEKGMLMFVRSSKFGSQPAEDVTR